MHIENEFAVELRNGRIIVNGVEYQSVVDVKRRIYQAATSLTITEELARLLERAIADGRLIERRASRFAPSAVRHRRH